MVKTGSIFPIVWQFLSAFQQRNWPIPTGDRNLRVPILIVKIIKKTPYFGARRGPDNLRGRGDCWLMVTVLFEKIVMVAL